MHGSIHKNALTEQILVRMGGVEEFSCLILITNIHISLLFGQERINTNEGLTKIKRTKEMNKSVVQPGSNQAVH